nr:M23 family metallopeptidase [Salsipaludibacter albus]
MRDAREARESRALAAAAARDEVSELEHEHDDLTDLADEIERAIAEREAAERAAAERAAAERAAAERAAAEEAAAASSTSSASTTSSDDDTDDDASDDTGDAGVTDDSADDPPPPTSGGGYAWPLCGTVTSEYKWRWGRQHEGIDIDDDRTDRITAAQSGTVISAGWNSGGYGNLVLIQHGDGVVTAYAHQRSIVVSTGQSVSRGQHIGYVGSTGRSTGPHLHFETRVGGSEAVNPRQFLSGGGC